MKNKQAESSSAVTSDSYRQTRIMQEPIPTQVPINALTGQVKYFSTCPVIRLIGT
jgi:hypothetical protein